MATANDIIDYSLPTMKAERALKDLHKAALLKNYDVAIEKAMEAVVESRMAMQNLKLMREQGK